MDGIIQAVTGGGGGGGIMSKLLPMILGGSAISGTVGNILGNRTRNSVLKQQMDYTKQLQDMTPAQLTKMIADIQQPLSKSLTAGVGNTVQAQLAERGLSQAPGIYATTLSQSLAPFQLQEQSLAQQALFQKLGLPISARPSPFGPYPQQTNISQLMQTLAGRYMKPGQPNNFSYWGAGNASPYDPFGINSKLSDLSNVMPPDLGNPDWLSQISLPGLTTQPTAPTGGG